MSTIGNIAMDIVVTLTKSESSIHGRTGRFENCELRDGQLTASHISENQQISYSLSQKDKMSHATLSNSGLPIQAYKIKFDDQRRPSKVMVFNKDITEPVNVIAYEYNEEGQVVSPKIIAGLDNLTTDQTVAIGRIRIDYLKYPPKFK